MFGTKWGLQSHTLFYIKIPVSPLRGILPITPCVVHFKLNRFRPVSLLPMISRKRDTGEHRCRGTPRSRGLPDVQYDPTTDDTVHDPNQGWEKPAVLRLHGKRCGY
jgi:hypothetical protein